MTTAFALYGIVVISSSSRYEIGVFYDRPGTLDLQTSLRMLAKG